MANGMQMKQMEMQLQQVTTVMTEVQTWAGSMEDIIRVVVDRKLEAVSNQLRWEM